MELLMRKMCNSGKNKNDFLFILRFLEKKIANI
jgi:hypothetical protein